MSHIAVASTEIVTVEAMIMEEALSRVVEKKQGASVVRTKQGWNVAVETESVWGYGTTKAVVQIVSSPQLQFKYDTDYSNLALALKDEVVQEYVSLATQVAMVRAGWQVSMVNASPGQGTVIKGVRA